MIYAGIIKFNSQTISEEKLVQVIDSFTQNSSTIIRRNDFFLCYGKRSPVQDLDEIWENNSAIILGRAFDKDQASPLKKSTFKKLAHLNKEAVLKNIWGKYVYFNLNEKVSQYEIVVDSTGQLPFFYYPFPDGSVLFASDIEIVFRILAQRPEYNWGYLHSYFLYGNSNSVQTPFENVFEVPPACSLRITRTERKTAPFWNPLQCYKNQEMEEVDAVEVLQSTLKSWVKPYQNVCVSLSGGLDSSALVYCLKDVVARGQTLKAINYFHSKVQSSNQLVHAARFVKRSALNSLRLIYPTHFLLIPLIRRRN